MAFLVNIVDMVTVYMKTMVLVFCVIAMSFGLWRMRYLAKRVEHLKCENSNKFKLAVETPLVESEVYQHSLYSPQYIAANIDRHIDILQQKTSELTQQLSSHYKTEASFSIELEKLPIKHSFDSADMDDSHRYDQVREWLEQGYTVENIVNQAGLSRAEVSLIHALSKPKNNPIQGFSEKA